MYQLILMLHVLIAIVLIVMVLIQHGKGADMGAAFGSGASGTVFGSQGVGGFLFKFTGGLAIAFFVTSLSLSYIVSSRYKSMDNSIPQPIPLSTAKKEPVSSVPIPIPKEAPADSKKG